MDSVHSFGRSRWMQPCCRSFPNPWLNREFDETSVSCDCSATSRNCPGTTCQPALTIFHIEPVAAGDTDWRRLKIVRTRPSILVSNFIGRWQPANKNGQNQRSARTVHFPHLLECMQTSTIWQWKPYWNETKQWKSEIPGLLADHGHTQPNTDYRRAEPNIVKGISATDKMSGIR